MIAPPPVGALKYSPPEFYKLTRCLALAPGYVLNLGTCEACAVSCWNSVTSKNAVVASGKKSGTNGLYKMWFKGVQTTEANVAATDLTTWHERLGHIGQEGHLRACQKGKVTYEINSGSKHYGLVLDTLLDSGSGVSFIKEELAMGQIDPILESGNKNYGINGSHLQVRVSVQVNLKLDNNERCDTCLLVVPDTTMMSFAVVGPDFPYFLLQRKDDKDISVAPFTGQQPFLEYSPRQKET
ncbi:hypothetical protein M0802_012018 [Mischocyttarus mexicanus]|nr:hypothetical protein M0802_012018 [Mischocyttarus mexicanus]